MLLNKEIKNSALMIVVMTSALYVHGLAFHHGFLRYWGLEESLFQFSVERTLVEGYYAFMNLGAIAVVKVVFACIAVFLGGNIFAILTKKVVKTQKPKWLFDLIEKFRKNSSNKKEETYPILSFLGTAVVISYGALIVILVLAILGSSSDNQGFEYANKKHEKLQSSSVKNRFSEIAYFTNRGAAYSLTEGNIITCSQIHCAVYHDDSVKVIRITDIQTITTKYMK